MPMFRPSTKIVASSLAFSSSNKRLLRRTFSLLSTSLGLTRPRYVDNKPNEWVKVKVLLLTRINHSVYTGFR